jgi:hypothetical protein
MTQDFDSPLKLYAEHLPDGRVIYAEIMPAASRWLPWTGRTSRWWFEIHEWSPLPGEFGVHVTTHAYTDYGSGGSFTLAGCHRKAVKAILLAADLENEKQSP